ncbi:MAG: hypothetical protein ACR2KK_01350 [Acidimicrobiales bacterium]
MSIGLAAQGEGQRVRAAYDDTLLGAARALQGAVADETSRVRGAAEKWIAAVTALLGTFSLAGVALGKEGIGALPKEGKLAAGLAVLLALSAAVRAIRHAYRAAYGWPVITDVGDDEKLRKWHEERRGRLAQAIADLDTGITSAVTSLACLAVAVGLVLFWPTDAPKPLVQVTRSDSSDTCGTLLDTTAAPQVRVKQATGVVVSIPSGDIQSVKAVKKCPA